MDSQLMIDRFVDLIKNASTRLPDDVTKALRKAAEREGDGSAAHRVLCTLLENAAEATGSNLPICQDSGTLIFHIQHGPEIRQLTVEKVVSDAVSAATERSFLRPNAVDPSTGINSGNNLGQGSPLLFIGERNDPGLSATVLLKGGGSENVGIQYALPDLSLDAERDLEGVRRCVLDAAFRAQGFGCAPGTLGVGVGGDRMTSYMTAKEQLLRKLDDLNPDPLLAGLEERLLGQINTLGIGPMGLGGKTTVLGVKIGKRHRAPASFFVSIAYMCWAFRRCTMNLKPDGTVEYLQ